MVAFDEVKQRFTLQQVADMLGLELKRNGESLRGPCPACNSGGPRALVLTPGKGYYCWAEKKGGDIIALVAHIRKTDMKSAAEWLSGGEPQPVSRDDKLAKIADGLDPHHEAVEVVGFCPKFAEEHQIGYKAKGAGAGYVLVPFRDKAGALLGFIGVQECWLPVAFKPKEGV